MVDCIKECLLLRRYGVTGDQGVGTRLFTTIIKLPLPHNGGKPPELAALDLIPVYMLFGCPFMPC